MKEPITCHDVEKALTCDQQFTPEQSTHFEECPVCQDHKVAYQQLDESMALALRTTPSAIFTERVMNVIETTTAPKRPLPLIERILSSLPLRICLLTGATVIVLGHIFRFIFTAFIVTMAAT